MIKRFAIIACANGLGHVQRQARVAAALMRQDCAVTLFAPARIPKRIVGELFESGQFQLVEFDTETSAGALRGGAIDAVRWDDRLPELDRFDCVISDNLPEVLARRPDAVMMGNFLWNEAIEGCNADYVTRANNLIAQFRPTMIASRLFAAQYLAEQTRLKLVGLFGAAVRPVAQGDELLVAIGRSGEAASLGADLVGSLASLQYPLFARVHVEPSLMPSNAPPWMVPATFMPEMFSRLAVAVCRPTVGVLTELLGAGVYPVLFHEPGNREMSDNAAAIVRERLGVRASGPREALQLAAKVLVDRATRAFHAERCRSIDMEGANQAVEILLDLPGSAALS